MFFEISLLPMSLFIGSYVKGSKINEALSWFYFTMFIGSVGMVAGLFMLGMFVDSFDMGTLLLLDYGSIRECFKPNRESFRYWPTVMVGSCLSGVD